MMDIVSPEVRSRMMSGIRGVNTQPELALRRELHRLGFRFRLHRKDLPGTPDLVFPRFGAAVFVHGCYWHRHEGCSLATTPSTRREFWLPKFDGNVSRDRRNERLLLEAGWRVAIVWECALRRNVRSTCASLGGWLAAGDTKEGWQRIEIPAAAST